MEISGLSQCCFAGSLPTQHAVTPYVLMTGSQGPFEQNTGTFFFRAERGVLDFVRSWMDLQRSHLLEWGPQQFDKDDMFQRRSDQVRSACVLPIHLQARMLIAHSVISDGPQVVCLAACLL